MRQAPHVHTSLTVFPPIHNNQCLLRRTRKDRSYTPSDGNASTRANFISVCVVIVVLCAYLCAISKRFREIPHGLTRVNTVWC